MQQSKKVIAVVGMAGSGKSELVNYLQEKYQWPKVYFGEITFDKLKEAGMEVNYENEQTMREKIRNEHGMGAYAKLSLPKIDKLLESDDVVIVESLYSWDEYKIIKERYNSNFMVIAVYACPKIRFERLKKRQVRPMRDLEEFNKRDQTEIEGTDKGGPIAIADYTVINEDLLDQVFFRADEIVGEICQK